MEHLLYWHWGSDDRSSVQDYCYPEGPLCALRPTHGGQRSDRQKQVRKGFPELLSVVPGLIEGCTSTSASEQAGRYCSALGRLPWRHNSCGNFAQSRRCTGEALHSSCRPELVKGSSLHTAYILGACAAQAPATAPLSSKTAACRVRSLDRLCRFPVASGDIDLTGVCCYST